MKNIFVSIIVTVSLFSITSMAADIHAICYTSVGGTTSFIIKTEDGKVNTEVFNHNGGGYAPFWSQIVVPNDLNVLAKKAEYIKKLDRGFKTSWKTDQCKWAGENKFSCVGSADKVSVNGLEVEPWALYSAVITDSSFAGEYEYIEMSISYEAQGERLNYTMRYPAADCIISDKLIEKTK